MIGNTNDRKTGYRLQNRDLRAQTHKKLHIKQWFVRTVKSIIIKRYNFEDDHDDDNHDDDDDNDNNNSTTLQCHHSKQNSVLPF
jgi:hypothetical protein